MPELPEVETVRRLMQRVLRGKIVARATVPEDEIVLSGHAPEEIQERLVGSRIKDVGRKGKFWWLELDSAPWVFGHLGMSGWIRHLESQGTRLLSHGTAPMDDESGMPRFLKLLIEADDGTRVAFTDGRRLGRLWLADGPHADKQVLRLGRDVLDDLPDAEEIHSVLAKRKAPIKALLLDQALFAGIGNWVADEVLYQAGIAPARPANSLSSEEVSKLRTAIEEVVTHSVEVEADHNRYPDHWLFSSRWGGKKGSEEIQGYKIVRETIGGRTTAWVRERQK